MSKALADARRVLAPNGIGVIVFAHKSTAGWEVMLKSILDAGWIITASWPIDTERPGRLRAHDSAALASSIHLVCRPRENLDGSLRTDTIGDWSDVLDELPKRIHTWMPRLVSEGVVGADAIFACLGPALEIFSRYSRVEDAGGNEIKLGIYLEKIWEAVAREALSQIFADADATGFEADARLTAIWLWTLFSGSKTEDSDGDEGDDDEEETGKKAKPKTAGFALEFDAARKIAQGLGANLEKLPTLVEVDGKVATLLSVGERAKSLFGPTAGAAMAEPVKRKKKAQLKLGFAVEEEEATAESEVILGGEMRPGASVLDRVHQAMILFGTSRSAALKRLLVDDGVGRDGRFWRLAQSLSALYPASTSEKRWVDGVLSRKKSFGF